MGVIARSGDFLGGDTNVCHAWKRRVRTQPTIPNDQHCQEPRCKREQDLIGKWVSSNNGCNDVWLKGHCPHIPNAQGFLPSHKSENEDVFVLVRHFLWWITERKTIQEQRPRECLSPAMSWCHQTPRDILHCYTKLQKCCPTCLMNGKLHNP